MNTDEMKAILDTSLAQMMGKINARFDRLDAKVDKKRARKTLIASLIQLIHSQNGLKVVMMKECNELPA